MMKPVYLISTFALMLQGCAKHPTDDWLVGGWTPVEESCDSDAGFVFERTGQVRSWGMEGTWAIKSDDLHVTITGEYGDDYVLKPTKKDLTLRITKFDTNSFETVRDGVTTKWKRCSFDLDQTPPPMEGQPSPVPSPTPTETPTSGSWFGPSEQKIIWEWTGGFNWQYNAYVIRSQCEKQSEKLDNYTSNGWKIVSSTPSTRNVNYGSCQGRDVVIER